MRVPRCRLLEFAGALAQEHGAISSEYHPAERRLTPRRLRSRLGIEGVIDAHRAQVEGIEAEHRALFEEIVRRQQTGPSGDRSRT